MDIETVRIDGKEYVAGSADARAAKERYDALRDLAYLEAHPELFERNKAVIARNDALIKVREDANATTLLARDLVFVSAQMERTVYERSRMMEFVRPDTNYPRGAESYARRLVTMTGEALVGSTLASDSPRAGLGVEEDLFPFRNVQASYEYSVDELERAAFARMPLSMWKRESCIDMIARGIDRIGRCGTATDANGAAKLLGFFNNAQVPSLTLANGEWATATSAEILADLQEIESTIIANAKDTQPGTYQLILPTVQEGILSTKRMDTNSDLSIKAYFLSTSRLIKSIVRYGALDAAVQPEIALADAPQGIVVPLDQTAAGIYWPMSIGYEELPPEIKGFSWVVQARARLGGVEFSKPFYSLYVQNLD